MEKGYLNLTIYKTIYFWNFAFSFLENVGQDYLSCEYEVRLFTSNIGFHIYYIYTPSERGDILY